MSSISSRSDLNGDAFYEQFYSSSGIERELVVEIRNYIASEMSLPAGKLRPSDRFDSELFSKGTGGWDSGYGELLADLQRLAKKKKVALAAPIATVDDYIKAMSEVY